MAIVKESIRRTMIEAQPCCVVCGASDSLHIDHIHPRKNGGTDSLDNLQVLCQTCNTSKGAKSMAEWQAYRAQMVRNVISADFIANALNNART